jgi:hypothetical protein
MRDVAGIASLFDRLKDCGIIEFLGFIQVISPGVTRCVIEADPIVSSPDRANDIPFHDLHMVYTGIRLKGFEHATVDIIGGSDRITGAF